MINRVKDHKIAKQLQRYLSQQIFKTLHKNTINNIIAINPLLNKSQMFYFCDQKRPPVRNQRQWDIEDIVGQRLNKSQLDLKKKINTLVQLNKKINETKLSQSIIIDMIKQIEQIIGSLISYVNNIKSDILNHQEKVLIMKMIFILKSRNKIFSLQYQKLMVNVYNLIRSPKLADLLLKNYSLMSIKQKHFVINFFLIYLKNNKDYIYQLKKQIQACQNEIFLPERYLAHDIILYLKQVSILKRSLTNSTIILKIQFVNKCHQHIIKYIGTLEPKFVANYIRFRDPRLQLERILFLNYIEEHLKKRNRVQNDNTNGDQIVHLMRILVQIPVSNTEDISKQMTQIRQIANQLVQAFNEKFKQGSSQKNTANEVKVKINSIRIAEINLLYQSLLKLSVIDYTFFGLLENMFFKGVQTARYEEIEKFIHNKVNFIKLVRASIGKNNENKQYDVQQQNVQSSQSGQVSSNLRKLQQDHKIFIEKLFEQAQRNSSLTLRQIFSLVNLCQKVPVKSRKLKKALQELIQKRANSITQQQIAVIQSMISLI